jgi:hypothetical protein
MCVHVGEACTWCLFAWAELHKYIWNCSVDIPMGIEELIQLEEIKDPRLGG